MRTEFSQIISHSFAAPHSLTYRMRDRKMNLLKIPVQMMVRENQENYDKFICMMYEYDVL